MAFFTYVAAMHSAPPQRRKKNYCQITQKKTFKLESKLEGDKGNRMQFVINYLVLPCIPAP